MKIQLKREFDLAPLSVHKVTRILFCKPDTTQLLKALKEKGHKNDLRISVNCPGHVHQFMECYSLSKFLDKRHSFMLKIEKNFYSLLFVFRHISIKPIFLFFTNIHSIFSFSTIIIRCLNFSVLNFHMNEMK